MKRLTVAIVFGGCSAEHDVSVKSAIEIARSIDLQRYAPIYIGITRTGAWALCPEPSLAWDDRRRPRAVISPDRTMRGLLVEEDGVWRTVPVHVVFPVLHGTTGEDGAVQGLLELSGLPYVGCGIESSAICMDKSLAYLVARDAGIATPRFFVCDGDGDGNADGGARAPAPCALTYPVFVKPARSGSSFGVTKVEHGDDLGAAVRAARQYDRKVLIEQAVAGTEVGCAVLGTGADLIAGEVDQITLRHGLFRIHQEAEPEKGSENAVVTVPAELPDEERERVSATAKRIYRALGCEGLARVDLFRCDDGQLVLNEVNTLPGFTAYSRYPRMMAAAGITMTAVIDRAIALALERAPAR